MLKKIFFIFVRNIILFGQFSFYMLVAFILSIRSVSANDVPRLQALGEEEVVYNWKTSRCDDYFVPDSPARAVKISNNEILLIAAHYENRFMIGTTFSSLKPKCVSMILGAESSKPEDFNTRFWVQGLMKNDQGKIVVIGSHEYIGTRFNNCDNGKRPPSCWYSSITKSVVNFSEGKDRIYFDPLNILAAPPLVFNDKFQSRLGFFTTSNIVERGDWAYTIVWAEFNGQPGNCIFRVHRSNPSGPWYGLYKGIYDQEFLSPYDRNFSPASCDRLSTENLLGPIRSVVYLIKYKLWVGVFSVANGSKYPPGVYYSFSKDLVKWDRPQRMYASVPWYNGVGCFAFEDYPSLIDHQSESDIFDSSDGNNLFLYQTRMNWENCVKGLDRDLIRVRVKIIAE